MGEAVGIRGKFKAKKERYPEIQKVLIEGLSQHLEPDDSPVIWENYFQAKEDCLKLCFESYGNYGRAEEWIRQKFSKEYSDVTVEFGVLVYDEYGYTADGYVLGDAYEGSRSSVVVTVEDCNNNLYTLEDEPFKCSPTNCGDAYFKGDLKKILLQYIKSEWEKVLVQNFEVVCDGSRENTQLVEELHVGARVDLEVIAYSKNDWFDRSYLNMRVYHKENLLGEIKLSELNGIDLELVHAILKGNKCSVSGLVTRVIPLSQRYKGAKKPLIQMKIVADQIETVEGIPEKILIYDTVKELCDFLTKSVEDDFGDMGGCYGDDVFEELFWTEHNQKLAERKKQFIENVMRNIKDISDIKTIYVQREYYAWGDSADWVADNDAELCEYAEKVMASKGKERKAIMDEMKRYIHTPRAERGCGIFARGMEIRYIWNYDDTELLKLCKRLINGERPDFECGREYKKIDLEKRQYKEYAEIELRYEMVEKREQVKERIKNHVAQKGKPEAAYFYDDCCVKLLYTDVGTGSSFLSDESFDYWEANCLIGTYRLQEEWEKMFKELGLMVPVFPIEYLDDDEFI